MELVPVPVGEDEEQVIGKDVAQCLGSSGCDYPVDFEISSPWRWGGHLRCSVPATRGLAQKFGLLHAEVGPAAYYLFLLFFELTIGSAW